MVRSHEQGIPAWVCVGSLILLIRSVTVRGGKIMSLWLSCHINFMVFFVCLFVCLEALLMYFGPTSPILPVVVEGTAHMCGSCSASGDDIYLLLILSPSISLLGAQKESPFAAWPRASSGKQHTTRRLKNI